MQQRNNTTIFGITMDNKKSIYIALTKIYGVGISVSKSVLRHAKVNYSTKVSDLTEEQVEAIRSVLNRVIQSEDNSGGLLVEDTLRKFVVQNIKDKTQKRTYEGSRHSRRLPVRGQRTKTNARTRKSRKKSN